MFAKGRNDKPGWLIRETDVIEQLLVPKTLDFTFLPYKHWYSSFLRLVSSSMGAVNHAYLRIGHEYHH